MASEEVCKSSSERGDGLYECMFHTETVGIRTSLADLLSDLQISCSSFEACSLANQQKQERAPAMPPVPNPLIIELVTGFELSN